VRECAGWLAADSEPQVLAVGSRGARDNAPDVRRCWARAHLRVVDLVACM